MGLCKCRVVTTLFCFQHRLNVCENCLVKDHETCVVKTYLAWLQDSDFDPTCKICHSNLNDGKPVVRLTCHDLFHVDCLDSYAKNNFPAHTAPAGYTCPTCKAAIIPPANNMSAVAQLLRQKLGAFPWTGLKSLAQDTPSKSTTTTTTSINTPGPAGLDTSTGGNIRTHTTAIPATPSAASSSNAASTSALLSPSSSSALQGGGGGPQNTSTPLAKPRAMAAPAVTPATASSSSAAAAAAPSTPNITTMVESNVVSRKTNPNANVSLDMDSDENKYARRPANAWFARLVGNRIPVKKNNTNTGGGLKRAGVLLFLMVIAIITLIEVLTRVRPSGDDDPLLNPQFNPNVHTAE